MIDNTQYNILWAPQKLKDDALTVYNTAINNLGNHPGLKTATVEIKTRLEKTADEGTSTFTDAIQKIDKLRNLNFFETFPELVKYYKDVA